MFAVAHNVKSGGGGEGRRFDCRVLGGFSPLAFHPSLRLHAAVVRSLWESKVEAA
jgi:hypothetical protein